MIRTILFDFDGTVADTLPIAFAAFRETFWRFTNRRYTDTEILGMFGPPEVPIIRAMVAEADHDEAIEHFYSQYDQGHADIRHPEVDAMLARLHAAGKRLGVVTGKGSRSAAISLERLGLARYFPVVITGDDVTRPKPDPEGIRTAMDRLGAEPATTVYVGDSNVDIRAARAAGVSAIGVRWFDVTQTAGPFEPEPDRVFDSPVAFADWVLGQGEPA